MMISHAGDIDTMPIFNRLILGFRPEAQTFIRSRMLTKPLVAGMVLYGNDEPFTHTIFPQTGIISLRNEMDDGQKVETTTVGNEGFVDFTYLMGRATATCQMIVRVPGHASWLGLADMEEAMERFVCVREIMMRYAAALIVQLTETIACNHQHNAEQRVSKWLLQANDRMLNEPFELTHQALADALLLRRATVSEICKNLKNDGSITYSRGVLSILDTERLKVHACHCYDRVKNASLPSSRGELTGFMR